MILDRFFVFEGLDGAGTTTQARLLADTLHAQSVNVDLDTEPTAGPIGTLIREVLRGEKNIHPCSLAYLFSADRHEHVYAADSGIVARLEHGRTIVSDRYVYSSLAYQAISCGEELVTRLNDVFPHPQWIFYLDVPVETCLGRIESRGRTELFEHERFLEQVAGRYQTVLEKAEADGAQVHRLDGTAETATIADEVSRIIANSPISPM